MNAARINLLRASPSCVHHSHSKPREAGERMFAWLDSAWDVHAPNPLAIPSFDEWNAPEAATDVYREDGE